MRIKSVLKQVFLTEEENKKLNDCMRKENIHNFSEFARKKINPNRFEHSQSLF